MEGKAIKRQVISHSPVLIVDTGKQREVGQMASMTSVAIPSLTGLRSVSKSAKMWSVSVPRAGGPIKASMKELGVAVAATAATAMLAGNAMAIEILLGGDDGSLAFVPGSFKIGAGEKIVFKNNAGYPHNIVFDEDEVPAGVDVTKISMPEEDLLNAPGETYVVTLSEKGDYSFYCSPHQGAGMVGKVTVE